MSDLNLTQPHIDVEKIQKAANEAAEKAYLRAIEDYYTSYDSPYRNKIKEELKKQEFDYKINIPDILQRINQQITDEVDKIANQAIAMSFVPMLTKSFTRIEKHVNWSDILKMIIEEVDPEKDKYESFIFNSTENKEFNWLNCELSTPNNFYEFTLHFSRKANIYELLSYPTNKYKTGYNSNMIIYKDNLKIEMPFTPGILEDKVLNVFFRVMLSQCEITMDCSDFDDSMFPEHECYCD